MNYLSYATFQIRRAFLYLATVSLLSAGVTWAQSSMSQVEMSIKSSSAQRNERRPLTQVRQLQPFTDEAYIPLDADISSIRLTRVKLVKVATSLRVTEDKKYCDELRTFRDPGGSEFCPEVEPITFQSAYRLTYSYRANALPGDEHGDPNFTFSVLLRPDAIVGRAREAITRQNVRAAAEYFSFTAFRPTAQRLVINESASKLCPGAFIEGIWTSTDATCKEKVVYEMATEPSQFLVVSVASRDSIHRSTMMSGQLGPTQRNPSQGGQGIGQ